MERTKELREQIGRAHEAGEAIIARSRENGWTDELHAEFDRTHKELGDLRSTLEAVNRQAEARSALLDNRESKLDKLADSRESTAVVKAVARDLEERGSMRRFLKYCRGGWGALNAEDRTAYEAEARALATSPDSAGGFLVPEEMQKSITEAILQFGGMRQSRSTIMRTRGGNALTIPQVDDTAEVGAIVAEGVAAAEGDPAFTELVLGAFKYTSDAVRISIELLQDNEIDNFEGFLGNLLGTRIGRLQNTHFTVGVGTTEPVGVVPASTLGETSASATEILKDEIIDLIHSVDPGYAANAEFMMNYKTLGDLRKLADTDGLPIWNDVQENTPSRLYGHPIIVNQDMADPAIDAIPILFGDFSLYLIRDVFPIRVTRTTELFWLESQVALMALARADGNLNDAGTAPVKHLVMAAS